MRGDPVLFSGRVDDQGAIRLENRPAFVAHCRAFAGQRVDVVVALQGELKTRLQESGFHAMITPWARDGGHDVEDLKDDLLREVFGVREHVNPVSGEVLCVLREPHTSKLNRTQYSELIERTLDIAAGCGYVLEAPHEYRERQRRAVAAARERRSA